MRWRWIRSGRALLRVPATRSALWNRLPSAVEISSSGSSPRDSRRNAATPPRCRARSERWPARRHRGQKIFASGSRLFNGVPRRIRRPPAKSIAFLKNVLLRLPDYRLAYAAVTTPRAEVGEPTRAAAGPAESLAATCPPRRHPRVQCSNGESVSRGTGRLGRGHFASERHAAVLAASDGSDSAIRGGPCLGELRARRTTASAATVGRNTCAGCRSELRLQDRPRRTRRAWSRDPAAEDGRPFTDVTADTRLPAEILSLRRFWFVGCRCGYGRRPGHRGGAR